MDTDVLDAAPAATEADVALCEDDLAEDDTADEDLTMEDLIEEVSIDGMCGVY